MASKIISSDQGISLIRNHKNVAVSGFVETGHPETIVNAIERSYIEEGSPRGLTLIFAAGQGNGRESGLNHLAHEGLVEKIIGGHWALVPKLQQLAAANKVKAYNIPQGIICQLYRDTAAGRPGTVTHVGLNTFVDPRIEGGKLNDITTEDIVELIHLDGKEYLFYKAIPIDVALIKASYSDAEGNAMFEDGACVLDPLSMAEAAKNSGGLVLLEVDEILPKGCIDASKVKIPGILVDAIIRSEKTQGKGISRQISMEDKGSPDQLSSDNHPERIIIAKRAEREIRPHSVVNIGIGIPEIIPELCIDRITSGELVLSVESGIIGGIPLKGSAFGNSRKVECVTDQAQQFDFYDGGGLDCACLGLAQCDRFGNINTSRFGGRIAGCGGFIDISQNTEVLIFCGTFTTGGLQTSVSEGLLKIEKEGSVKKFVKRVDQITYNGNFAGQRKQKVLYITERAVFKLEKDGIVLVEIAPGINLEHDILANMDFIPLLSDDLKLMDPEIFKFHIGRKKELSLENALEKACLIYFFGPSRNR